MNIYFEADLSEFIQGDAFGFTMVLHPEVLGALIPVDNEKDGFTMYPMIH